MLTNTKLTYYHKELDDDRNDIWTKKIFEKVWWFGDRGSSQNKGYEDASDVDVRIPLEEVESIDIFTIGDILYKGEGPDIETTNDLPSEYYHVTSYTINAFGGTPHVHLGGK